MKSIRHLLRDDVAEKEGYSPGHEPAEIIMDANESPYDLPPEIKEAALDRMNEQVFNRYPDSKSRRIRKLYGEYAGIPPEYVVAGNGSDELITNLLTACIEPGEGVVLPRPTFSMYGLLAEHLRARVREVPLDSQWDLPDEFVEASRDAKITFISYPNNPTGNCFSRSTIQRVLEQSDGLVVVDEAYYEFAHQSFVDQIAEGTPLVVLRTLSKGFSLAGIRTGFLLGPPSIVAGVNTVRLPYNLNLLSQVTARVALEHRSRILERNRTLLEQRDRLWNVLDELGFDPYPTDSNFILFQPPRPGALYEHLLDRGIRIRSFSNSSLENCLRLSVGTPDENDELIDALEEF